MERPSGRTAIRRDAALVAILLAADLAFSVNLGDVRAEYGSAGVTALLCYAAAGYAALLGRRLYPVAVFGVVLVHAVVGSLVGYRPLLAMAVALFTVAASRDAVVTRLCLVLVTAPAALAIWIETAAAPAQERALVGAVMAAAYAILFLAVAVLGGRAGHARRRIGNLESEREAVTLRAVEDERRRLARELHDTVSHVVSLISIQAGAARRVLEHEPDRTDEVLGLLENIQLRSREGMGELRRLLDVMRDRGDAPAPSGLGHGLADVDQLVSATGRSGLHVTSTTLGTAARLDPSVDLTAYRVVQEALTNVARHAGPGSTVDVVIDWRAGLRVEVSDTGPLEPPEPSGVPATPGVGLIGMAERVRAVGGRLDVGPRADEPGFQVTAVLPVAGAVPTELSPADDPVDR